MLDGHPTWFALGKALRVQQRRLGVVAPALIAERAEWIVPFHDLVPQRVCEPVGYRRYGIPALRRVSLGTCRSSAIS